MTSSRLENPLSLLPTHSPIFNASVASAVSNICGTTTSHPLDTIRVRMQLERRKVSATHMLRNTIRLEGVKGLYKGLSQPLMGLFQSRPLDSLPPTTSRKNSVEVTHI